MNKQEKWKDKGIQVHCYIRSLFFLRSKFIFPCPESISNRAKRRIAVICLIIDSRSLSGVIRVKPMMRQKKKNAETQKMNYFDLCLRIFFFCIDPSNVRSQDTIYLWLKLWLHTHRISGSSQSIFVQFIETLIRSRSLTFCLATEIKHSMTKELRLFRIGSSK